MVNIVNSDQFLKCFNINIRKYFKGILHTILFYRVFGNIKPKEVDLLDITYVGLIISNFLSFEMISSGSIVKILKIISFN